MGRAQKGIYETKKASLWLRVTNHLQVTVTHQEGREARQKVKTTEIEPRNSKMIIQSRLLSQGKGAQKGYVGKLFGMKSLRQKDVV